MCRLLAQQLGAPASAVRVARGASSRHKLIEIAGVEDENVETATRRPPADESCPGSSLFLDRAARAALALSNAVREGAAE